MLEIIVAICAIVFIILTPIQTGKVLNGWAPKRFKGEPSAFRANFRKQLSIFVWLGPVFCVLWVAMGMIDPANEAYLISKLVIGGLWLVAGIVSYVSRRRLDEAPAT